jgi:hypothetical protein
VEKPGFSAPDASSFRGESIDHVLRTSLDRDALPYEYLDADTTRRLITEHVEGRHCCRWRAGAVLLKGEGRGRESPLDETAGWHPGRDEA